MSDVISITIPADEDGYILLECPKCLARFKMTVSDLQSDETNDIWCPAYGLTSGPFFTDDVIELAKTRALNAFMDEVHSQFKGMERKTREKSSR